MIMRLYVLFIHHIQSLDLHNFTKSPLKSFELTQKSLEKVVQICKSPLKKFIFAAESRLKKFRNVK